MQSIKLKVLTVFMSLVMAISLFPALNSNAAGNSVKCGDNVYATLSGTTLTISGTGPMYNYTAYYNAGDKSKRLVKTDAPWFGSRTGIEKIVIGDGVSKIGDNAFACMTYVKSVEFQSKGSLKAIGTQAFYDCWKITSLALPYGLTSIGANAFVWCYGITAVSLPGTLKTIGYGAFAYCEVLTRVYIPKSVTSIGDFAFKDNWKLVSVTGGAGLTSIGRQAFEYCSGLKTFKITSKKLSRIGSCCFYCCNSLKTIYIKKTTKLKKKKVKGSLYFSSVKKVKVKKSKVRKYKKFFTYRNCGKRGVKVRK